MHFPTIRIQEGLHFQVSVSLVFGGVVLDACDDGLTKLIGLFVALQVVRGCSLEYDV